MSPPRIGRHVSGGPEPEGERERRERTDALREAFARWACGVTIVAVREQGRVHALTASAFVPVSLDPALVLVGLGPNAAAAPYLDPGTRFGVSVLAAGQRALATRYADSYPVGAEPFGPEEPPLIDDALATLSCVVEERLQRGDHELVIGRVDTARVGPEARALVYFRRSYDEVG